MVGACGPTGHKRAMLVRFTLQGYNGSIRHQSLSDMSTLIIVSHRSVMLGMISYIYEDPYIELMIIASHVCYSWIMPKIRLWLS